MSPRSYFFLWIAMAVAAAVLFVAGQFTMLTVVVFGFIAFGLTFMGMMCVLPGVVSLSHEARPAKKAAAPGMDRATTPAKAFARLKSA